MVPVSYLLTRSVHVGYTICRDSDDVPEQHPSKGDEGANQDGWPCLALSLGPNYGELPHEGHDEPFGPTCSISRLIMNQTACGEQAGKMDGEDEWQDEGTY